MFVEDRTPFFNTSEFAEVATYNGTSINVVETVTSEQQTGTPGFSQPVFTVLIDSDDVSYPRPGDSVTFRGFTCSVGEFITSDGKVWAVGLYKATVQA